MAGNSSKRPLQGPSSYAGPIVNRADSILAILGAAFFGILLGLVIELIHLPTWVLVAGTVTTGALFVVVWRLGRTASAQVAVGDLVAFD